MKILLILLVFISQKSFAVDTGDGSDGTCDITGAATTQITAARKTYQCTTLTLDGNLSVFNGAGAGAGGSALIIKVQNDVILNAGVSLDLSGAPGVDGDNINANKPGGNGGAGGSAGGASSGISVDGTNGAGAGGGIGGKNVNPNPGGSFGGGGGGGAYKTRIALEPQDGDDSNGAVLTTAGVNGTVYGNEASFETSFTGGSGGAAGGAADDTFTPFTGSSGGGGGGAVHIISGGDITIDGTILVNGGNGGGIVTTSNSGGGGGGSGGAIWLQAAGTLTISATGTLSATGGNMGINNFTGFGGDGGLGRIRLDDGDGVITNNGTVTPAAYTATFTPTTATSGTTGVSARQYSSSISCARAELDHPVLPFLLSLLLGLGLSKTLLIFISKKRIA